MKMENNLINSFNDRDEIAIIGMAGRFPGANNINVFWQNLQNSLESIDFFTDEELLSTGVEPTLFNDQQYVKAGTVLEDIELFDASFFGFTPRDAEITDPQHRIFMECVWEALENAGYDSATYTGQIGLFAGTAVSNYLLANLYPNQDSIESVGAFPIFIGNDKDHLTTQISYKLDLKGPSVNVQTTCSTSLVAVHLASQSLLNGESDIALAGGVSIEVPQKTGYLYQEGEIHSPDGHCRTFDVQAQGTIFGSGSGVVVLKRLEDAVVDGDRIQAVIKASACVVSGTNEAIIALEKQLSAREIECRLLHTSHAFHSVMMKPILKAFSEVFPTIKLNSPNIRFISNVTGDWITEQQVKGWNKLFICGALVTIEQIN